MPKGFLVAPVAGRTVLDPFSIGRVPQRRVGWLRSFDGTVIDPVSGKAVPREVWTFAGDEPEVVTETSDHFFRRAILDGDLDYLESVEIAADGKATNALRDLDLMRATKAHKAARVAQAAAEAAATASELAAHAAAVAAIEST